MNSRGKFEAAMVNMLNEAGEDVTLEQIIGCRKADEYIAPILSSAWWAWKASREAIEVELPQRWSVDAFEGSWVANSEGANLDYAETVQAIKAAGLKVKPC